MEAVVDMNAVVDMKAMEQVEEDTESQWTLWGKMRMEWKNYKRKGDSHQRSHHEKYAYDERKDRNNDNPYVQDYTPETRTQLTEQSTQSAHEVQARHNKCNQKLEDDHSEVEYQKELHQDIFQTVWKTVVYL